MHVVKKVIGLAVSAALTYGLLAIPVAVLASDQVTQDNTDTGNNSVNKNKTKIKREAETIKKAKAKVKNNVTAVANTGNNQSNHNTTGGTVTSGAIGGTVGLTNTVNQNANGQCCCGEEIVGDATIDQTNQTTGNNSTNINKAKIKDESVCKDITKAKVKNDVSLTGNTGGNEANGNTTGGSVGSGDVTFGVTIANTVN